MKWDTFDSTDLDYTPLPLATRNNTEDDFQFTQEVRFASAAASPVKFSDTTSLRWQSGVFFFTQNYDQFVVQTFSPCVIPGVPVAVQNVSPDAELDDLGFGVYGQGTLSFKSRFDLSFGARVDYESKDASISTSTTPPLGPATSVQENRSFYGRLTAGRRDLPRESAGDVLWRRQSRLQGRRLQPRRAPEQRGVRRRARLALRGRREGLGGRRQGVALSASFFSIDWEELQLNVPVPFAPPGTFYISNVGGATSRGVEFDVMARPHADVDLFASVGTTSAHFASGTDVGRRGHLGEQDSVHARLHGVARGAVLAGSEADLADLRARGRRLHRLLRVRRCEHRPPGRVRAHELRGGVRSRLLFAEVWVKNAFDTRYVPLAIPYPGFAPSGFVGEPGRPRTFGVSLGVGF